jgi:uncharacterized damage-inducible protein DinB
VTANDVRRLFDYNYWARDRQLKAVAAIPTTELTRPLGGSFPSLRDHLVHIMEVESLWYQRFQGAARPSMRRATEFPDVTAIAARWAEVEGELRPFVARLQDADLERVITGRFTSGASFSIPLGDLLQHVVNHGSYHRGQVTTLIRQLGYTPVAVDWTVFVSGNG